MFSAPAADISPELQRHAALGTLSRVKVILDTDADLVALGPIIDFSTHLSKRVGMGIGKSQNIHTDIVDQDFQKPPAHTTARPRLGDVLPEQVHSDQLSTFVPRHANYQQPLIKDKQEDPFELPRKVKIGFRAEPSPLRLDSLLA